MASAPHPGESQVTSVCGLKLLLYAALSYYCMRPKAPSVSGLKLLVYALKTFLFRLFQGVIQALFKALLGLYEGSFKAKRGVGTGGGR